MDQHMLEEKDQNILLQQSILHTECRLRSFTLDIPEVVLQILAMLQYLIPLPTSGSWRWLLGVIGKVIVYIE